MPMFELPAHILGVIVGMFKQPRYVQNAQFCSGTKYKSYK